MDARTRSASWSSHTHFWDWIWWPATKAAIGRDDPVSEHLPELYGHLLRPMGIETVAASIDDAINAFVGAATPSNGGYASSCLAR